MRHGSFEFPFPGSLISTFLGHMTIREGPNSKDDPQARYWYFFAKQPAPAPYMLRIVPRTVPRVGRSYEHFPDGFEASKP